MTDPWAGEAATIAHAFAGKLPARLARLAEVSASGVPLHVDPYAMPAPDPVELPEVRALVDVGWHVLDGAPLHRLLPAAWPTQHRTWVPDRLPRVTVLGTASEYWSEIVAVPADQPDDVEWIAGHARQVGLSPPPQGRIWMVRSPWPAIPVDVVLEVIWRRVNESDDHEIEHMYLAARDVFDWDEPTLTAAIPRETSELLEAWLQVGRSGEDVSALIEHHVMPAGLRVALGRSGLDEDGLLAWLRSLETVLTDEAVQFMVNWRSAGLPGDPPPGASRFVHRSPAELLIWLDAGFDLYAAARLEFLGLETALRWQAAGASPAETYEAHHRRPARITEESIRAKAPIVSESPPSGASDSNSRYRRHKLARCLKECHRRGW